MEELKEGDHFVVNTQTQQGYALKLPQYLAACCATIGAFALGTVVSWTSPTAESLQSGDGDLPPLTTSQMSWVGAFAPLGATAVVIPVGWLIDALGRKITMLTLVPPFVLGWALIAWAQSTAMMYVGRFITGACGGAFTLTAPVYISEIAEASNRGTLGSFVQMMVVTGILFVYVVGKLVSMFWLSIICMIVPIIFGATFLFMPETPLYRLQKGQRELAEASMRFFRGDHYDIEPELRLMEMTLEKTKREKTTFVEAFKTRAAKKGLMIAFGLMFFQQLSGINAVLFYTSFIFASAGSELDPDICAMIVGLVLVLATAASFFLVDRLGRKLLLLIFSPVMSLCTLVIGIFFYLKLETNTDTSSIGWLPLVSTCIFIIVFSLSYGPIAWIMIGEIFPPQIKGFASSLSLVLNWFVAFLVTKFYSDIADAFGNYTTFWIFSAITILGTVFAFFVLIETKGKTLDEIQRELQGGEGKPTCDDTKDDGS